MAIKDILLLLRPNPVGESAARFALSLAQTMGAHLTAVGVALEIPPPASFIGDYPYETMTDITRTTKADIETAYGALADVPDVAKELLTIQATAAEAREQFASLARRFDISVIGQSDPGGAGEAEDLAHAALFGSGRAVFMIPHIHRGPAKLGKALVAWDGGQAAARAVAEALPVLTRSGEVEVVMVAGLAAEKNAAVTDILPYLARHGVSARGHTLPGGEDVGSILLSYAADASADYLVMGAYSHSRMREFILGGATRSILESMTIPTLMAH